MLLRNTFQQSCKAAYEKDVSQDDQAQATKTIAVAAAQNTELDELAIDVAQRQIAQNAAADDQAAADQVALAAWTMANQNAQATYDTSKAQAVSAYQNALSQADLTWASDAADAIADAILGGLPAADADFAQATADRQLAYANAKVNFASSVGNARIAQAQAKGTADIVLATDLGNAESTANSACDTADTNAVNSDSAAIETESQSEASAVATCIATTASNDDALLQAIDGYAVTQVTTVATAAVARQSSFANDDAGYQVAVAQQQEQQQAAQAAATGSAADQFQTQADQQRVNWLLGVAPVFVTSITDSAQAKANDLSTEAGSVATEDGTDADADVTYTQGEASLGEADATNATQEKMGYQQTCVGISDTWSDLAVWADAKQCLADADAQSEDLVDNATAEKTYQVAIATAARNGLLPASAGGLTSSGVAAAIAAAEAQQTADLWNAEIALVTNQADAELAWADTMAGDNEGAQTQDSTTEKNRDDALAEVDESYSGGLIPLESAYNSSLTTAEIKQRDSEEQASDTLNGSLNSAQEHYYTAAYNQQAAAMEALAGEEPSPWMQYREQLAAAQQSWWSGQLSDFTQLATDQNNAADAYETAFDGGYQTLSSAVSTAASTEAQTMDGAVLTQDKALDTASDDVVQNVAGPMDTYIQNVAQAKCDLVVAEVEQAAGEGTANTASYQSTINTQTQLLASAEVNAACVNRTAIAEADLSYDETDGSSYTAATNSESGAVYAYSATTESPSFATEEKTLASVDATHVDEEAQSYDTAMDSFADQRHALGDPERAADGCGNCANRKQRAGDADEREHSG